MRELFNHIFSVEGPHAKVKPGRIDENDRGRMIFLTGWKDFFFYLVRGLGNTKMFYAPPKSFSVINVPQALAQHCSFFECGFYWSDLSSYRYIWKWTSNAFLAPNLWCIWSNWVGTYLKTCYISSRQSPQPDLQDKWKRHTQKSNFQTAPLLHERKSKPFSAILSNYNSE